MYPPPHMTHVSSSSDACENLVGPALAKAQVNKYIPKGGEKKYHMLGHGGSSSCQSPGEK